MAESEEINLTILENALAPNALLEAEITDFGQVQRQVFNAARDGHPLTVYSILKNQAAPDKERILKECVLDADGQNCPPLVIAARNGHESVVKILLTKVSRVFSSNRLMLCKNQFNSLTSFLKIPFFSSKQIE